MVAFLAMIGSSAYAVDYIIDQRFTSVAELDGKLFTVVNETESKAFCFPGAQDLAYSSYADAMGSNSYFFKLEAAQGEGVEGYYYLRTYKPDGTVYYVWGNPDNGYFNSQSATGWCCFSIGKTAQTNGQDIVNGAVWALEESGDGKIAIKNIGTGLYLKDAGPAKYDDPTYFTFCTLKIDLSSLKKDYDALKAKVLAINAGIDVSAADALADAAASEEDFANANAALFTALRNYLPSSEGDIDVTSFLLVNPSFEDNFTGWTQSGMQTQGNTSFGKDGGKYAEAWQPNGTKSVSQTLTAMPQGTYTISVKVKARGITSAKVFANGIEVPVTIADAENVYTVVYVCEDGEDITFGAEGVGTGAGNSWFALDNFTMKYNSALPELTPATGKMVPSVAEAQDAAIATYNADKTIANYKAALAAVQAAQNSAAAYASAKAYLDKMGAVLNGTNVYTAAAYDAQYGSWLAKYDASTLTNEEAAALNADKAYNTGWHSANNIDEVLLSAWTVDGEQAANYDKALYINTWSVEGNTDGSEFYAPFFEYWTGDDASLGAKTLQAKITGLTPNADYGFSIRARARQTNGQTIVAGKIMLQVGEGEAVDIAAGAQFGTTPFFIGNYIAVGKSDAEGTLTATITVGAESNVSWLSYYDCKYVDASEIIAAQIAAAKGDLDLAIKDAAKVAMLPAGEDLFTVDASANEAFNQAKADAKTVYDNAEATLAEVEAATAALQTAIATYKAAEVKTPVAGKAYFLIQKASGLYMNLTDNVKVTTAPYAVQFIANGTGWTIASVDNAEVAAGMAGGNTWSMNNSVKTAWTLTPTIGAETTYTITGPNGQIGTDNTTDGSTCYGNKSGEKAVWTIETDYATATLAVSETAGYATFVAPFDVKVPAGVTASKATGVDAESNLVLEAVEGTIPANTPVILASASDVSVKVYGKTVDGTPKAGLLTGVYEDTPAPAGSYVLQNQTDGVKFYLVGATVPTVKAGHAYLTIEGAGVKAIGFGGATAINGVEVAKAQNGAIFNLAGQQLNGLQKGINIVNGKKVLVK